MTTDKIESIRLVTRGYELSSKGFMGPAQLVRYFEHSRWRTIGHSSKIPVRKFWLMGVVRGQTLEMVRNLSFDAEVEITTWMSGLGRTSVTFSHELRNVAGGELMARSSATIVALTQDRRPQPISEEARQYIVERDALAVERFDEEVRTDAWEHAVSIRPSDQDLQQHVNHARYLDYVEDARWFAAREGAYGSGDWDGAVKRFSIAYEREARVGDPLVVRTWRRAGHDHTLEFALLKDPETVSARARVELVPLT